jgi:hypothetical protein
MAGSSHACSTRLCPRARPALCLGSGSAPLEMECPDTSKGSSPPERRLDLALPWSQQPVREWIRDPANCSDAPRRRPNLIQHQVIYASRVPRLSGPDLLEKHRSAHMGTVIATPSTELTGALDSEASTRARLRRGTSRRRSFRWQILLLAAVMLSLSTPVF